MKINGNRIQGRGWAIDFYRWIGFDFGSFITSRGEINHYLRIGFAEILW